MSKDPELIIAAAHGKMPGPILAAVRVTSAGKDQISFRIGGKQGGVGFAGLNFGDPGGIVLTATHMVTVEFDTNFFNKIKDISDVKSEVPLRAVDSITSRSNRMEIMVKGAPFKVEGDRSDLAEFVAAFEQAKAAAPQ